MKRHTTVSLGFLLVVAVGCGGGDGDSPLFGVDTDGNEANRSADVDDDDGDGAQSAAPANGGANQVDLSSLGPAPTATTRSAILEVEGDAAEYKAVWSTDYRCIVTPDEFDVDMQTIDSNGFVGSGRLGISGNLTDGVWFGTGAFTHPDLPHTDLFINQAEVVVSGSIVTYRGPMVPRDQYGQIDPADRLGVLSIDCGGEFVATTTAGEQTATVDINAGASYGCASDDASFDYRAEGGVYPDITKITIDGRVDGEGWIGTAVVDLGADRYVGVVRGTPDLLDAGPTGVTWSGEATHTSDDDAALEEVVSMSITIPCE